MNSKPSFMLIGPIEAGKSTLFKALLDREGDVRKTQAVEYGGEVGVDTPGEYFSHPRLYHALINTASDIDTIVYVHPCNELQCRLPPGLLDIYGDKNLVTVITKTDLENVDPDQIEEMLRSNGVKGKIFRVSNTDPSSIDELRNYLLK
ncbi:EutP/PduV family microcompartment system protein [Neisseria sp. Ec49-e6-T10]|uniref:EutP/PduV family microcompartment system protein n=1 Tax=Neisseria sp. Ec49-e6-T10 TaxID=3140744 RepID=UPI003EBA731A